MCACGCAEMTDSNVRNLRYVVYFVNIKKLSSADLNLLPVFQVLLEERNTGRAAAKLYLTQPAISRNLARLRTLFNDPLFTRTPKGLAPTPRAEALALQLQNTLLDINQMIEPPQFIPDQASNTFRLATTDYGAHVLLPSCIDRLRREAPGVNLEMVPWQESFTESLTTQNIDMATCAIDTAPAAVHGRGIGTDRFVCVVREGHPLTRAPLSLQRYAQADHALITMGGSPRTPIDTLLDSQGLTRRIALRVPHFVAALALIANNDLLLTIPYGLALKFASHYKLKLLTLPLEQPDFTYSIIWHERHIKDPAHMWFRQLMFEELTSTLQYIQSELSVTCSPALIKSADQP